jgi:hypothetical protein
MDAEVSTHTFLTMVIEESVCFMSCGSKVFVLVLHVHILKKKRYCLFAK